MITRFKRFGLLYVKTAKLILNKPKHCSLKPGDTCAYYLVKEKEITRTTNFGKESRQSIKCNSADVSQIRHVTDVPSSNKLAKRIRFLRPYI